jgi:RNA repair pathway DNA polymerase beta family
MGGSELQGAKVCGTDDLDLQGVYSEPPEMVLGFASTPHFIWSTAGEQRRNSSNEVEVTLYSGKKWAGLGCQGNPRALHFSFAVSAVRHPLRPPVVTNKNVLPAGCSAPHFTGSANHQLKPTAGQRDAAKGPETGTWDPELEMKYIYDVKAVMPA